MNPSMVLLFCKQNHRLTPSAREICGRLFPRFVEVDSSVSDSDIAASPYDLLVSFLSERILSPKCLHGPCVNFHPGLPAYPGRGGASYALYDGVFSYGATAHRMNVTVDSGKILSTHTFPINPWDGCGDVFAKAEKAALDLFHIVLSFYAQYNELPAANGEEWSGPACTRKQFDKWLIGDHEDPVDLRKKVNAAKHPIFPGPYVIIDGMRFKYDGEVGK